jgi:cytochrome c5
MSANEDQAHESFIKTPKHLVIALVLGFAIPVGLALLFAKLATSGRTYDRDSPAMSAAEIAKRIQPVADADVGSAAGAGRTLKTGQDVYKSVCAACHATGLNKAPKFGDRRDWARFLKSGQKSLVQVALKGQGAMPPRGGSPDLSDIEIERAVVYMANAAGAKFTEPAARAAPKAAADSAQVTASAATKPDGKKVYETTCVACHAAGVANAPKFGDKKAWAPHLAHGVSELHQSALKGKGAMPPKGGNLTLSEAEVKAAVDYMLNAVK